MDYKKLYARQKAQALEQLLSWCGDSPSQLARIAGVSVRAVQSWRSAGQISPEAATRIAAWPGCPLTRDQMRPDIRIWDDGEAAMPAQIESQLKLPF